MPRPPLVPLLFGLTAPIDRRTYLITGLTLMLLKYAIDATLIYHFTGITWTPLDYLSPALTTRTVFGARAEWLVWTLAALTLPFLWIGLTMSVRRAINAGKPAALGLLFLFPALNYLLMLTLATLPPAPTPDATTPTLPPDSPLRAALIGSAAGALVGLAMATFAGLLLGNYGLTLFFVTPAIMGSLTAWIYNRTTPRPLKQTIGVALLALLIAATSMLLFAVEGILCLIMAFPLAAAMASMGALIGRHAATSGPHRHRPTPALLIVLALPLTAGLEHTLPTTQPPTTQPPTTQPPTATPHPHPHATPANDPLREVITTIEIDAPPAAVWPHVIGFTELPPPAEWIFRAGIAYPLRARIEGTGLGATRHCEFSTGAFIEPITHWQPPTRLSFDVIAQPAPMHELSPYRYLHPPHLDGYFRSRRGEFRLTPLPNNRTRLEGSTWYALDLHPVAYWSLWSDALIHAIHQRVLAHVKSLAERGA